MNFGIMFFMNLGMLITVAYVGNVIHKYIFANTSKEVNYILSIILIVFAGWVSMFFGFQIGETVIFDLRFIPLLIATVIYRNPLTLILIGCGIGLLRLSFGLNPASIAGMINLILLGILCAGLNIWMQKSTYRLYVKALIVIFVVNIANCINIAIFGVYPFMFYMTHIVPITLPICIVLSCIFALILRDFQLEQRHKLALKEANQLLMKQKDDLHQVKLNLQERAEQLALASKYKTEFLANMSHELRTPLNGIINFAQLITESEDSSADSKQYGSYIYRSGQDLLQLINDILDLSKVEAGRLEILHEEVSVHEFPDLMQVQFQHIANEKNIEFHIEMEPTVPNVIYSDANRIGQILRNLLANAFKFTSEGVVSLSIEMEKDSKDSIKGSIVSNDNNKAMSWIIFHIIDSGIGVPEDKRSLIFEPFQQADGSISRRFGGTGLGLPISCNLARLLGGCIRYTNRSEGGSMFSLYLPAYTSPQRDKL